MDEFNVIITDKDIENVIKVIASLKNVYMFIGGINPFDKVDIKVSNNIFIVEEKAVNIKDITGINIYTSTVANNYELFDVTIYTANYNLQVSIPYSYKEKLLKCKKPTNIEYYFEHPVVSGIVPVDNQDFINRLNNMDLKEGEKVNENPPVYVKSIQEDGMIILSSCTEYNS